jgi:hypothetical protein
MDRNSSQPLTTEQAKARLRVAAEQASPSAWVRRRPLYALSVALLGGFVAGRLRTPTGDDLLLVQKLIAPFLLGVARRK